MKENHPQICLFQPEIPQNTGNIGRLAAATGSRLHLIQPFGFSTDDRNLLRPGLDYWPFLDVEIHASFEELIQRFDVGEVAFFSKFSERSYTEMESQVKLLVFGQETSGFPEDMHKQYAERMFSFPMYHSGVRSLNLSNCVAIATYHQLSSSRRT